jgi:hypothetical protein
MFVVRLQRCLRSWLSRLLLGRQIGEGFWPLGFATAVLIKPIFGNGDLESSQ